MTTKSPDRRQPHENGSTDVSGARVQQPPVTPDVPSTETEDQLTRFEWRVKQVLAATQHAAYAAAAEVAYLLQRGLRLTGEPLYQASFTQALRMWWELVDEQINQHHLEGDHAVRRVRSWARTYLTAEPTSTKPGSLLDHGLAHASRAAARRFLAATGELLASHATCQGRTPAPNNDSTHRTPHDQPSLEPAHQP
ncbi:hypothetical protein GBF35_16305 [Nonomuraea phyllanthi]|uniref:hypothetical protein n=1 Tax=Nonomuraea phyllanthi TaxID=2219224 RepID=UPI0012938B16|nr:hypothetical protein [Nonomuraea phyllanthi]QFY08033.1 hypothetical protein GBF35_16305 [Nonomuraea phyllanthi]